MWESEIPNARILIVDDQRLNVMVLERMLAAAGYTQVKSTHDSREVLPLCRETMPDLLLLDLHMPHIDGYQIMEQLRPFADERIYLPILVLTADTTPEAKRKALSLGARDFLSKPFDTTEALLRIHNLLETRFLYLAIHDRNRILEDRVHDRTRELEEAHRRILDAEREKKRFSGEVIRCVTHDKLHLVDAEEIPTEGDFVLTLPLETPEDYSALRRRLGEVALGAGMDVRVAKDLVLAVGEAAMNAIKHAAGGVCAVGLTGGRIIVRVSDRGPGIRPENLPATLFTPGFSTKVSLGMGYTMMLEFVDRIWLATSSEGTVLQLEKWIRPEEHPDETIAAAMSRF